MKYPLVLLTLLGRALMGQGQNIIPNPSFELQLPCTDVDQQTGFTPAHFRPWQTYEVGLVHYHNECLRYSEQQGCTHFPKDGKGYIGIGYRADPGVLAITYLHTKLLEPLQAGSTYYFELFFDDAIPGSVNTTYPLGVHFSRDPVDVSGLDRLDLQPQIFNVQPPPFRRCTWNQLRGCFVPEGGEEYITIGMFFEPDVQLFGHMFVDDLQLVNLTDVAQVLGPDVNFCNDEGIDFELDATHDAATKYTWQDGDTNAIYTVRDTGMYWVQLQNECFAVSDTIHITRTQFSSQEEAIQFLCEEMPSVTLQGPAYADYYNWSNGSVDESIAVSDTGRYVVHAGLGNCLLSDTIDVLPASRAVADIGADTVICRRAQTLTLVANNPMSSISWIDGSSNDTFQITKPGQYWVAVTNQCGTSYDSIRVDPDDCECAYYLPNAFSPNGDHINDQYEVYAHCKFTSSQFEGLQVFDRWGNLVFSSHPGATYWDGTIKGEQAPSGVYLVRTQWSEQLFDGSVEKVQKVSDVLLIR